MQFTRREKGIWIDKEPCDTKLKAPERYCILPERSAAKTHLHSFVWFWDDHIKAIHIVFEQPR